jgi:hypothetical protein
MTKLAEQLQVLLDLLVKTDQSLGRPSIRLNRQDLTAIAELAKGDDFPYWDAVTRRELIREGWIATYRRTDREVDVYLPRVRMANDPENEDSWPLPGQFVVQFDRERPSTSHPQSKPTASHLEKGMSVVLRCTGDAMLDGRQGVIVSNEILAESLHPALQGRGSFRNVHVRDSSREPQLDQVFCIRESELEVKNV